ncbi:MAG TPA: DUF1194 domain-containing protein [Pseudolabrys sp.]|nr:DUF1194 domain-containing protein [Pseudolabrys sp.]
MTRLSRRTMLLLPLTAVLPASANEPVDLLLVLAADVSRSVDHDKFELQRRGYATALADRRVLNAIASGAQGSIAICFVEWSGLFSQKVVVGWTKVDGPKAAQEFGDRLLESPRSFADRTSISSGIDFAAAQFANAPFSSPRQKIDVSGDGTNNAGRDVTAARDETIAQGITINGLAILSDHPMPWNPAHTNPPGGLAKYYQDNVIGGPGAFVLVAKDFNSFGEALINKLVAEIAGNRPPAPLSLAWKGP